jgi:hypothetical protein
MDAYTSRLMEFGYVPPSVRFKNFAGRTRKVAGMAYRGSVATARYLAPKIKAAYNYAAPRIKASWENEVKPALKEEWKQAKPQLIELGREIKNGTRAAYRSVRENMAERKKKRENSGYSLGGLILNTCLESGCKPRETSNLEEKITNTPILDTEEIEEPKFYSQSWSFGIPEMQEEVAQQKVYPTYEEKLKEIQEAPEQSAHWLTTRTIAEKIFKETGNHDANYNWSQAQERIAKSYQNYLSKIKEMK